jgi:4-phosphopantoate--beta-alanine ligase
MTVPKSHPRYESLMKREKIIEGMKAGIVADAGLIAHGRGEAFDYLIGERTLREAELAEKIAAFHLILASHPVISVNGNTAVLVPKELVRLSELVPASLEINLFYRTSERVEKIANHLRDHGAKSILGEKPDAEIPDLDHKRALCSLEGTMKADVILVPLEDGDRALALKRMGKTVITIDLNPLSRTSKAADVTIVDDVVRAVPKIIDFVQNSRKKGLEKGVMHGQIRDFNNQDNIMKMVNIIRNGAVKHN